jgi:SET domain-containing protein
MPAGPMQLSFFVGISPTLNIRGILAARQIKKGVLIEKCPIVLIGKREEPLLKRTVLRNYYYEWDSEHHCFALGYGSLLNHSYTPNARYVRDYETRHLIIRAHRHIKKGEEITINYNCHPDSTDPLEPHLLDFDRTY